MKNESWNLIKYIIKTNTLTLTCEEKTLCESNLSLEEIGNALMSLRNNKSPGADGLTINFFFSNSFWQVSNPTLLESYNYNFANNTRNQILWLIHTYWPVCCNVGCKRGVLEMDGCQVRGSSMLVGTEYNCRGYDHWNKHQAKNLTWAFLQYIYRKKVSTGLLTEKDSLGGL